MLKVRGGYWHYDFSARGKRFRGMTGEKVGPSINEKRAKRIEAVKMAEVEERGVLQGRTPTLGDFSKRFLEWVENSDKAENTKRYYRNGWVMLAPLGNVRLSDISSDMATMLKPAHSSSYTNQGLRTLRRMLGKAQQWKLLTQVPRIKLAREHGREGLIDAEAERKLLLHADQPLRDVLIIIQDTGMRPEEVFRMKWENVNWQEGTYFNPKGKTFKSRRTVPLSQRVQDALFVRRANVCSRGGSSDGADSAAGSDKGLLGAEGDAVSRSAGVPMHGSNPSAVSAYIFPSKRAKEGHLTTVAKQFREARKAAGLPKSLVLYCARHTYATYIYKATQNLKLTMDLLGHSDVRTAMRYQHPEMELARKAIEERRIVQ